MQRLTEADYAMVTVVNPRVFVSPTVVVGQGSTIMAGSTMLGRSMHAGLGGAGVWGDGACFW